MKTILVTSDLTYAPQNYNDVLDFVLKNSEQHIAGVILIRINTIDTLLKLPYLYFAGCNNIAKTLTNNIADKLLGRKKKLLKNYRIPFIEKKSVNDVEATKWIQSIRPDLILNMRARCIYKDIVLRIPRFGCVNVHHGILPEQRGLFCDLYALAANRKSGFTIHKMTDQIDRGQILYREEIEANKNYIEYLATASSREELAIVNVINKIAQNDFPHEATFDVYNQASATTTPDFKTIKKLQHSGIIL